MQIIVGLVNVVMVALVLDGLGKRWLMNRILPLQHERPRRFKGKTIGIHSKRKHNTELSKNFYRLYKYITIQITAGSRPEDIYKSLYKIVHAKALKAELLQFSVILTQRHDIKQSLEGLKKRFDFDEGQIFVGILESMSGTGLSADAFMRLDHMLFQKYLSGIRAGTDKVRQLYLAAVVTFTAVTTCMLLFPILHQMFYSAKKIFI
jgi:hypothetical protein